ncbi:MAG: sugar phosphate isomerase/epimerase [Pseudonocardia sp.]|nr:sugar phosphate isomerase/epimerase [Pseudonocardia sp.]
MQRLDAAAKGGFSSVSMFPVDEVAARAEGLSHSDMRSLMADRGVTVAVLDPFCQWVPQWRPPPQMSRADLAFMDFDETAFLTAAQGLGVESVSVIEVFGQSFPVDALIESFAGFCDRAAERGLRVHLEFMPFSGIPDLATGWEIVSTADRPNGGLVLDLWHYFRGRPDNALLATIPGEKIYVVQVCDADSEVRGTLLDDSMHHRKLPGQGSFDIIAVLRILAGTGGLGSVGAEVFSDELAALGPDAAARRAGNSLHSVLDAAELSMPPESGAVR